MAWTEPRTWVVGEIVTAAIMNTHVRDNLNAVPHVLVRKPSDESVTSSTVFQADDHLLQSVSANEVWEMEALLYYTASAAGDFKYRWTFPTGGTLAGLSWGTDAASASSIAQIGSATSPSGTFIGAGGALAAFFSICSFLYVNGSTAGSVALEWAQNTSDATATIVKAQSLLLGMKVA